MVRLVVISASDAFEEIWPVLAHDAGAELTVVREVSLLDPQETHCAWILSVAGEEDRSIPAVHDLARTGRSGIAVIGAVDSARVATAMLKAGADDYFALPEDLIQLRNWVVDTAEAYRRRQDSESLAAEHRGQYDFSRIVGKSPGILAAIDTAAHVIASPGATVLISGETGTGKELVAQAIHYNGPRAAGPFVEINCAALPRTLLEGELFGYERGAFTDARIAKPGLLEVANRGTVFLDEVGELPLEMQAKLLKVIEDRKVRRLGSVKEQSIDVQIIAATNLSLEDAVGQGRFRADLYYRLSVVPIRLPPLRERHEDVLLLTRMFFEQVCRDHRVPIPKLSHDAEWFLRSHSWPGNVRELRNAIERAVIMRRDPVSAADFSVDPPVQNGIASPFPFPASMRTIMRSAARSMVTHCAGNKSAAAGRLGISRKQLYALLSDPPGELGD